jgi:hypothetical protein
LTAIAGASIDGDYSMPLPRFARGNIAAHTSGTIYVFERSER